MCTETPEGQPDGDDASGTRRVLLVDDEPIVRAAMQRYFARLGWLVFEAEGGDSAQSWLERADPDAVDVVICDLRMPRGSGEALYGWVCRARPCLASRLVFSTGDALSAEAEAFLRSAGRPVLTKPFELVDLARIVAEVAGGARAV